jgi:hypothetical protein
LSKRERISIGTPPVLRPGKAAAPRALARIKETFMVMWKDSLMLDGGDVFGCG